MATINPERSQVSVNMEKIFWETLTTGDTAGYCLPQGVGSLAGSVQVTGTFGGATVVLEGSNDGTNYVTLTDITGFPISLTAAGLVDFSTACAYVRPAISGGSSDDVDVTVILRN